MILDKSFASRLLTTAAKQAVALCIFVLLTCGIGCASSGTLQPHQAFRQATTPYQGQQSSYGAVNAVGAVGGLDTAGAGAYAGYGGYNNSLLGYDNSNVAAGNYGAYGNQFSNPYATSSSNMNVQQIPAQSGYSQYAPNAGYNYQPSYSTGFTSGSC